MKRKQKVKPKKLMKLPRIGFKQSLNLLLAFKMKINLMINHHLAYNHRKQKQEEQGEEKKLFNKNQKKKKFFAKFNLME